MKFFAALAALAAVSSVSAHGVVKELNFEGGASYTGPDAAEGNPFHMTDTPIRQLALLEPIGDITSSENICGRGAAPSAKLIAPVKAGSKFSFKMKGGGDAPWPHVWGPVMCYLAKCPGSARDCDPTNLKFFKIDQRGLKPQGGNTWYQEDLHNGGSVSCTIPKGIANGDYLLRIEILALHNAMRIGGAESTVSCTQVSVSGGGGGVPAAKDLVKFPAYSQTDAGIHIDIWNGLSGYKFPGPAPFTGGNNSGAPASIPDPKPQPAPLPPINAAPAPTKPAPSQPTDGKTCRRNRRRAAALQNHRVRRGIAHGAPARYYSEA